MGKFRFVEWLLGFLITIAVVLFSAMNAAVAQNGTIKILYYSLLVVSMIGLFYFIYKIYNNLNESIFISPMKKAALKQEELSKTDPNAKPLLNKKQVAIISLAFIGFVLIFVWGVSIPPAHPVDIIIYFVIAVIIVLLGSILIKPKYCPKCGTKLPVIRKPKDENERLYGWTTCPNCGTQVDNHGNAVKK